MAEELKQNESRETDVCDQLKSESEDWYDVTHTYLSVQFCQPSVWFDSFFSNRRVDEEVRAGTHVRWQNDYILTEGGDWKYVSNIHASFKLPHVKESINLVFEGDEEDDLAD
ncbi:MAG: hypothetical protein KAT90_04435, partial [Gammaproteobacteria bacterium]|nr:hypothetical protein [Gammaproteobacteria bacterium]